MDRFDSHRYDSRPAARDDGLGRISRITRWIGVGALGGVAILAGYVAQAKPGKSTSSKDVAASTSVADSTAAGQARIPKAAEVPTLSTGGGTSLTPPAAPPAPVSTPAPTVSGGS